MQTQVALYHLAHLGLYRVVLLPYLEVLPLLRFEKLHLCLHQTTAQAVLVRNPTIRDRRFGPELVIIKKGEHGVLFYSDKVKFSFPAFPIEEVQDPTGAGDTFAGGVMGYLTKVNKINEKSLKTAIIYGTTMASFNVQGFGNERTAPLTMVKVEQRKKELLKFITY